ncbi:MAG: hypothetical protein HQL29_06395 [Candidatus Omnitrophica bacterium]|nr:hypothetical protein [Candidatus Omnitrophota bacterium]
MEKLRSSTTNKTVLLGITGSIAAYKAIDIISILKKKNINVHCVATASALKFVTKLSLETVSGNTVHSDMFEKPQGMDIEHISLADRADLILIAPATANIIGKLASGIADDLLTCTVWASKCQVLIAPAMNNNMYTSSVIQDKIKYLKKHNFNFVGPIKGQLACGKQGIGHIEAPETIAAKVLEALKKS